MLPLSLLLLAPTAPTLIGRAVLPAHTLIEGPTSGQVAEPANGRDMPLVERQPVQGVSCIITVPDGRLMALADNGYGAKANSPDFLLGFHSLAPDYRTRREGLGGVVVERTFRLSDPDRRIPFPIVADLANYPGTEIRVDSKIVVRRLLTGADFDPESFRLAKDGTLWIGEEFGPFLLQVNRTGRLLRAPIPLPGVTSPDSPLLKGEPNLGRSKGFEGMAVSPDGTLLYPMLEGPVTTEGDKRRLRIYEFDTARAVYTNQQWEYRLEDPDHAIGELLAVDKTRMLVVERDNLEGAAARFKRIFLVDLARRDADGTLRKQMVVDLMDLADPDDLDRDGNRRFTFPFMTIESVALLDRQTLVVVNDNNYPYGNGRRPGYPDPTEMLLIRLPKPL